MRVFNFKNRLILLGSTVAFPCVYATNPISPPVLEKLPDGLNQPLEIPKETPPSPKHSAFNLGTGQVAQINLAILQRDWVNLEQHLALYRQQEKYDPLLYDYALGILYRSKQKYTQAIALYEAILQNYPQFDYIRFDLAVMLFENKQYRQAERYFKQSQPHLNANLQRLAQQYLTEIGERQAFQPTISLNYERTNNVNQAAKSTEIHWLGQAWQKTRESLPQKAEGVRYGLGVAKSTNLTGNHFLQTELNLNGIYYWNNKPFNEQNLSAELGWQHQSFHRNFSITPFWEYTWLEQKDYSYQTGVRLNLNQRIKANWRLNVGSEQASRHYFKETTAKRYNAHTARYHINMQYQMTTNVILFGGVDLYQDKTIDKELASNRYGMNIGILAEQPQGLGSRISFRYAQRHFKEKETLVYHFPRKDNEYFVQFALWHNRLNYKGFMPKWHIRYQRIDSNMKDLYSRDNLNTFISIEKRF